MSTESSMETSESPSFRNHNSPANTPKHSPYYMKYAALFTVIFICPLMAGNNAPIDGPVKVSEVTFSSGIAVKNDDDTAMPTPHWEDKKNNQDEEDMFPDGLPDKNPAGSKKPNEIKSYAYAYTSNTKPAVGAVFKWKGAPPADGKPYHAEGEVIDTPNCKVKFERKQLQNDTVYPVTISKQNIVNERKIQAYLTPNRKVERNDGQGKDRAANIQPLKIKWTVTDKNGKTINESISTHTIYVVWDEPKTDFRQETLFNLSCVMLDLSEGDVPTFVHFNNFMEFEDQAVRRMDANLLSYYKNYNVAHTTTDLLLDKADGQCGAWIDFFIDCGKIQGTDEKDECRRITPQAGVTGFIVKDWDFGNKQTSGNAGYPYLNIPKNNFKLNTQYDFMYDEVKDNMGIIGQNNKNPASLFGVHFLMYSHPLYYDPSYGKKYGSIDEFESNIAGYFIKDPRIIDEVENNMDANEDGVISGDHTIDCYLFKENPPGLNLWDFTFDY